MTEAQTNEEALIWTVHSESLQRPVMRGWARTEAGAMKLLEKFRATDPEPEDEYWLAPMHPNEIGEFAAALPSDQEQQATLH